MTRQSFFSSYFSFSFLLAVLYPAISQLPRPDKSSREIAATGEQVTIATYGSYSATVTIMLESDE